MKYKNPIPFGATNTILRNNDIIHQTTNAVAVESPTDLIFAFFNDNIGNINRFKFKISF